MIACSTQTVDKSLHQKGGLPGHTLLAGLVYSHCRLRRRHGSILTATKFHVSKTFSLFIESRAYYKMSKHNNSATSRLKQDYLRFKKDPIPYVVAEPLPSNILEWHYVVSGPESSPYEGGYYHGKLLFPAEFPFKPPSIFSSIMNLLINLMSLLLRRYLYDYSQWKVRIFTKRNAFLEQGKY